MVLRDRNADGNTTTGTGGLEERLYALQDANWNTTAIVAAPNVPGMVPGSVINRFAYTPYGESQTLTASWATPPAGSTPAVPWAHLFQGLKFNDVTGLAYVRNRDYSASLGRFIELDPIGFSAGDNNWYRFVGNGPTGKVDPSGLDPIVLVTPFVGGPFYWRPHTGNPYSHSQWLSQDYKWTYSKHSITFAVNTRLSDSDVLNLVFRKLRRFQHFESDLAGVTLSTDESMAYFDLKDWGGWASDRLANDSEVQVILAHTSEYELTGTTAGRHQLIGIRKWRVFLDPKSQMCGRKTVTIETEADERPYGPINRAGANLPQGRTAQVEIWKGYLERTAAETIRELGGNDKVGAATLPDPPTEASRPRPNRFFP
jgi:RHS repeat-associated protein